MFVAKKIFFFEKINKKSLYPISNFKINESLKNNKNYIGTFSKNNVPILKNNQSTIVNLANSNDKRSHWIGMKLIGKKLFYVDSYVIPYIPDIIKKQYSDDKIVMKVYRIQDASGFLGQLFSKIPILNKII